METTKGPLNTDVREIKIPGDPPLAARLYMPPGGTVVAGAVLAHGLASCQEEFEDLPAQLARQGIAALTFDYRGHGQSGGERSYNTAQGQEADLERAAAVLEGHSAAAAANLFLIGHSVGCVSTLKALAAGGDRFVGGVLMAPGSRAEGSVGPLMLAVYDGLYQMARWVHGAFGIHVHVPYQFTYRHLYADPEAVRRGQTRGFLQRTVSLLNYPYLFGEMDNVGAATKVQLPMLVVVGSEDRVIPNDQSRTVFDALAVQDKEWVRLVGAGHSLLGDRGADEAMRLIGEWILARVHQPVQGVPKA